MKFSCIPLLSFLVQSVLPKPTKSNNFVDYEKMCKIFSFRAKELVNFLRCMIAQWRGSKHTQSPAVHSLQTLGKQKSRPQSRQISLELELDFDWINSFIIAFFHRLLCKSVYSWNMFYVATWHVVTYKVLPLFLSVVTFINSIDKVGSFGVWGESSDKTS